MQKLLFIKPSGNFFKRDSSEDTTEVFMLVGTWPIQILRIESEITSFIKVTKRRHVH
jgi:hypothetical protein